MRAILAGVLVTGLLCCFAVAQDSEKSAAAQDKAAVEQGAKRFIVSYRIGALPVWSKDREFDPTLLMRVIQSSVNPESWKGAGGASIMEPSSEDATLVVITTRDNHNLIASVLKGLR